MSWDCDICGKGYDSEHADCRRAMEITGALDSLNNQIGELTTVLQDIKKLLEEKK